MLEIPTGVYLLQGILLYNLLETFAFDISRKNIILHILLSAINSASTPTGFWAYRRNELVSHTKVGLLYRP